MEKIVLVQVAIQRRGLMWSLPISSPVCRFFEALFDEFILEILLTWWVTIEDLSHFDVVLLNRMDRGAYLSILASRCSTLRVAQRERMFSQIR